MTTGESLKKTANPGSKTEFALVGLVFLVAFQLFRSEAPTTEFASDEGLNLAKAYLVNQGFGLYSEVWSDQPPLFTMLLSGWMDIWGWTPESGRRLVAVFSAVLLTSLYTLARYRAAAWAALLACGLLLVSNNFYRATGTVLIGLPAIALALLALACLRGEDVSRARAALSGCFFASALATKLFVGVYFPVFLLALFVQTPNRKIRTLTWLLSLVGMSTLFIWLQPDLLTHFWEQLVWPHSRASEISDRGAGLNYLRFDLSLTLVCLFSCMAYFRRLYLPVALLAMGLLPLAFHRPSFWHHYFLASVPLCWAAGVGIYLAISDLSEQIRTRKPHLSTPLALAIVCLFGYIVLSLPMRTRKLAHKSGPAFEIPPAVLNSLKALDAQTKWICTDRPFFAFVLKKRVPPELAVLSEKRITAGSFSYQDFFAVVKRYQPEQIVLSRFPRLRDMAPLELEQDYRLVLKSGKTVVYQRKDLVDLNRPSQKE
jgi:4-amino-4-deoxy-L-arabinose transferase-like glycosyltransferase